MTPVEVGLDFAFCFAIVIVLYSHCSFIVRSVLAPTRTVLEGDDVGVQFNEGCERYIILAPINCYPDWRTTHASSSSLPPPPSPSHRRPSLVASPQKAPFSGSTPIVPVSAPSTSRRRRKDGSYLLTTNHRCFFEVRFASIPIRCRLNSDDLWSLSLRY